MEKESLEKEVDDPKAQIRSLETQADEVVKEALGPTTFSHRSYPQLADHPAEKPYPVRHAFSHYPVNAECGLSEQQCITLIGEGSRLVSGWGVCDNSRCQRHRKTILNH